MKLLLEVLEDIWGGQNPQTVWRTSLLGHWPTMAKEVAQHVDRCHICLVSQGKHQNTNTNPYQYQINHGNT